jgi:hypothetical protein
LCLITHYAMDTCEEVEVGQYTRYPLASRLGASWWESRRCVVRKNLLPCRESSPALATHIPSLYRLTCLRSLLSTLKIKLSLSLTKHNAIKTYGEMDLKIHVFMSSALVEVEWSGLRPYPFTPPPGRKSPRYQLDKSLGGSQAVFLIR